MDWALATAVVVAGAVVEVLEDGAAAAFELVLPALPPHPARTPAAISDVRVQRRLGVIGSQR
jgi:hypothetical protein